MNSTSIKYYTLGLFLFIGSLSSFCQTDSSSKHATFHIGSCKPAIAGVSRGKISHKALLKAKKIDVLRCTDSTKVISFGMTIAYNKKENYVGITPESHWVDSTRDEYITQQMKSYIRKAPVGSTVSFINIRYCRPNGESNVFDLGLEFIIDDSEGNKY